MGIGFKMVDCDGHILEPIDIWDRYVEPAHRESANQACGLYNHPDGGVSARINGELCPKGMQGGGTFGIPEEMAATLHWSPEDLCRGGFDGHARVTDQMDPGDIEAVVIFGSLGNVLNGVRDGELLAHMCRGYNDWVSDEYCAADPQRLFPMGYLPWQTVPLARDELKRIAAKGFRGLKVPAKRRLMDKPLYQTDFDPLWADAEEAGLVLSVHPSVYWDNLPEMADVLVAEEFSLPAARGVLSPMNGMISLTYLIYGGVLDRFPDLKACIVECNGGWMPPSARPARQAVHHVAEKLPRGEDAAQRNVQTTVLRVLHGGGEHPAPVRREIPGPDHVGHGLSSPRRRESRGDLGGAGNGATAHPAQDPAQQCHQPLPASLGICLGPGGFGLHPGRGASSRQGGHEGGPMTSATGHLSSAELRRQVGHPIIDSDGHYSELMPVFRDYFLDYAKQAGGSQIQRQLEALSSDLYEHLVQHNGVGSGLPITQVGRDVAQRAEGYLDDSARVGAPSPERPGPGDQLPAGAAPQSHGRVRH